MAPAFVGSPPFSERDVAATDRTFRRKCDIATQAADGRINAEADVRGRPVYNLIFSIFGSWLLF
jgi:hypothetical protein